jgi:uncharacterized protein with ParB-like and HNH nuclease domain
MQQLTNIDTIFKKKIFRIPDYQRGYAWQIRQLTAFWEDINSLETGKNHYTGVLSLEVVLKETWSTWTEDSWIIENKGYTPFFVVDGQQRLTTCIIFIQAIMEEAIELPQNTFQNKEDYELCDTKISDIKKDFIFIQRSGSILRSYIFGYEKDNPSYEFLKTRIFNEVSTSNQYQETLYTQNLENAKKFFRDNLRVFAEEDRPAKLESLYKNVTRHLLFNEYVIQNDVDVFVAFETMNNRGKKLSDLELLKNRLIYLTTLYRADSKEKAELRKRINDSWRDIYYQLGRNKDNSLNDDDYLKAHWIMYFKYSRKTGDDYIDFLLDDQFSPKKVLEQVPLSITVKDAVVIRDLETDEEVADSENGDTKLTTQSKLTIKEVSDYAVSIQKSAIYWFKTFNPFLSDCTQDEKKWMDCLNRIGIGYFRPLVMSSFAAHGISSDNRVELFKAIERFIFIAFRLCQARGNYRSSKFYNLSRDLYYGNTTIEKVIETLNESLEYTFNEDGSFKFSSFYEFIANKFKYGDKEGFYGWGGIRYFLYEYEQNLFGNSKNQTQKIEWEKFINTADTRSIEHILPQTPAHQCWQSDFGHYSAVELTALTNSIGNLLALSQPKNSSLQNYPYLEKRADKNNARGYFNGSYSENRVAEMYKEWTAKEIKSRSLELLAFMEQRWLINLGDESTKLKLLNLEFLTEAQ